MSATKSYNHRIISVGEVTEGHLVQPLAKSKSSWSGLLRALFNQILTISKGGETFFSVWPSPWWKILALYLTSICRIPICVDCFLCYHFSLTNPLLWTCVSCVPGHLDGLSLYCLQHVHLHVSYWGFPNAAHYSGCGLPGVTRCGTTTSLDPLATFLLTQANMQPAPFFARRAHCLIKFSCLPTLPPASVDEQRTCDWIQMQKEA